ncbi:hypothetical protein [Fulvivirga ligni]|uniref:hypothetical protein n=1 Tax=Fulvivirga ligni TaxID=2904246 RepID=UPI001F42B8E8|nr:hypothetical protein [Fulvivirga ligni]UII21301.1 hypothetical protein LVD16_26065 [Fulvivirga ligni]
MNKLLYALIATVLVACNVKSSEDNLAASTESLSSLEQDILSTFQDVDSVLKLDNGVMWGEKLNGPIIIVDADTRVFYSNEDSDIKGFKAVGSIFTDSLPDAINTANTALNWNGKRWSMLVLPLPERGVARNNLVIHELFHRLQPAIGFDSLQERDNAHLDTYQGRLLLRLELQALEKALLADDDSLRLQHIENALMFRDRRQATPELKEAENSLELNEGLAEFTGLMLSGRDNAAIITHLIESKNVFFENPTFVRSFAYQTVPIYGFMLNSILPGWHRQIHKGTNLSDFFVEKFSVSIDENSSIDTIAMSNDYSYEQILNQEREREKMRLEKIAQLKVKFSEKPVLELPFQNMNISFDPRNITPLEELGTVYPNLRVTDNWGVLTVTDGALLASDWSKVTVSAPKKISISQVSGSGWQLELAPEWQVVETADGFQLSKR